ncbi:MAG: DUF1836 domain-containing protein [Bacillus sp. (in: firmicutes)]
MENLDSFLNKLNDEKNITVDEIPDIDLYMDQVIQLFENKYGGTKRNEDEKILTKTMINNYAKGKLFMPVKNKKYSKEHLLLISLIYQLKGTLTIKDIKDTLDGVNKKVTEEGFLIDGLYNSYLRENDRNKAFLMEDIPMRMKNVQAELADMEDPDKAYLEKVLFIASLANMSNLYRRIAEKLVDEIVEECKEA